MSIFKRRLSDSRDNLQRRDNMTVEYDNDDDNDNDNFFGGDFFDGDNDIGDSGDSGDGD